MAFIQVFAAYVPQRIVTNAELAARLGCEPEWIKQASGIMERRYAAENETIADMAVNAGSACLKRAARPASAVKLLIVATGSEPRRFPGVASSVAHRLGLEDVPAIDVPVASAGSLTAMILGNSLASTYPVVLIVAAEKMSTVVSREPLDRNTAILFGDGAGACLLDAEQGGARIVDSVLHSDGAFANNLALEADGTLTMDGRSVILHASRKLPRAILELLERNRLSAGDVPHYLMHQANQNLLDGVARALRVPEDRFFSNIAKFGNTSSASLLIAGAEWQGEAGFRAREPVVFTVFGAGFCWGALLAVGV